MQQSSQPLVLEVPLLRKSFFAVTFFLSMAFPLAHAAKPDASSIAFRRASALDRGINLSGWFAQTGDLSADHIAKHTTTADFTLIHDLGFTYVRLGVDPSQLKQYGPHPAPPPNLALLDQAISYILAAHLAVSLCVFPNDDYKRGLATDNGADEFIQLWRLLAQHYATSDPDHVFFELLNEPQVMDPYRWDGLQAATVEAIRKVDTAHTIIATAAKYSGLSDLLQLSAVRDNNVIYNFHFYEPHTFTHQGAGWGMFEWNFFRDIPYPATPAQLQSAMARVPDDAARYSLYQYGAEGWNAASIEGRLAFARAWADEHDVPVICNEFGAYRETVPSDSRVRYIHDVRAGLEQLHIGWAMWDYSGDFGVVTKQSDGRTVPDASVLDALGLHRR